MFSLILEEKWFFDITVFYISVKLYLTEPNLVLQALCLYTGTWNRRIGKIHVDFASAFSRCPMGKVSRHKRPLQGHLTNVKQQLFSNKIILMSIKIHWQYFNIFNYVILGKSFCIFISNHLYLIKIILIKYLRHQRNNIMVNYIKTLKNKI